MRLLMPDAHCSTPRARAARSALAALAGLRPRSARVICRATMAALVAAAALTAQAAPKPAAAPIEGVINRIIDGDTLVLQPQGKPPIDVRLRDVDAPEICQAHGPEAKKALEQLALGKTAQLTVSARDSHGRSIGLVTVDGQSLSKLMVAEGHAWSTRGRYDRGPLMKEERMAIALRRGLHATEGAVMPKDFRKTNGPCK